MSRSTPEHASYRALFRYVEGPEAYEAWSAQRMREGGLVRREGRGKATHLRQPPYHRRAARLDRPPPSAAAGSSSHALSSYEPSAGEWGEWQQQQPADGMDAEQWIDEEVSAREMPSDPFGSLRIASDAFRSLLTVSECPRLSHRGSACSSKRGRFTRTRSSAARSRRASAA